MSVARPIFDSDTSFSIHRSDRVSNLPLNHATCFGQHWKTEEAFLLYRHAGLAKEMVVKAFLPNIKFECRAKMIFNVCQNFFLLHLFASRFDYPLIPDAHLNLII